MGTTEKKGEIKRKINLLALITIVTAMCLIPCMKSGLPYGDDIEIHMLRVESIYKALKTGQGYPVYIYNTMLDGYGYGMGLFYPDIFLLPAVLFRFLGASPEIAMKLYLFIVLFATCGAAYYAGRIFAGERAALIVMVLYVMGHYHLQDMYRRFALGEVIAMAFIPLAIAGLYDFTENRHERKGLLCFAFTGLLLSHTISFVLCVIVAILWVLFRIKKVLNNKKTIVEVIIEAVLCALITCYYWIPMLEQFVDSSFYVTENPAFETNDDTMTLLGILCGRYSVSFAEVGILLLLVCFGALYGRKIKKAKLCLIVTAVLFVIETKLFPWRIVDKTPLISIQFPWRLNMFTEWFTALGIGTAVESLLHDLIKTKKYMAYCVICSLLVGILNLNIVWQVEIMSYIGFDEGYTDEADATFEVGFYEWLPAEGDGNGLRYSDSRGIVSCDGEIINGTYTSDGRYEFDTHGKSGICEVPKYYYKGYVAEYVDENGQEKYLDVKKNADNGFIELNLSGAENRVSVFYKGTDAQKIAACVSLVTMLIIFAFAIKRILKR